MAAGQGRGGRVGLPRGGQEGDFRGDVHPDYIAVGSKNLYMC